MKLVQKQKGPSRGLHVVLYKIHLLAFKVSNRLGLCDMYYVFYRLLSMTHFRELVY